ncbi:MAG TPA: MBL fold metallo-hydrolase [Alphaproteobacteria bacterium]|nr:MBL fold metallo-hydrolase [Alphaproteobacteria bacterium]
MTAPAGKWEGIRAGAAVRLHQGDGTCYTCFNGRSIDLMTEQGHGRRSPGGEGCPPRPPGNGGGATRITYVGHSTVLIDIDGVRILTDPLFRRRVGGFLRRIPPVPPPATRRNIDAVLISHLHFDHLDLPSLDILDHDTRLIVPHGADRMLRRKGFTHAEELRRHETLSIRGVTVQAIPAVHSDFRWPFGPVARSIGFLLCGSRKIYFAGDTDIFQDMEALHHRLDTAILPVWGWGPWLGHGHLTPARAAIALRLLRPRRAIPIHWGTYCPVGLCLRTPRFITSPPREFARISAGMAPDVRIDVLQPGETALLSAVSGGDQARERP